MPRKPRPACREIAPAAAFPGRKTLEPQSPQWYNKASPKAPPAARSFYFPQSHIVQKPPSALCPSRGHRSLLFAPCPATERSVREVLAARRAAFLFRTHFVSFNPTPCKSSPSHHAPAAGMIACPPRPVRRLKGACANCPPQVRIAHRRRAKCSPPHYAPAAGTAACLLRSARRLKGACANCPPQVRIARRRCEVLAAGVSVS